MFTILRKIYWKLIDPLLVRINRLERHSMRLSDRAEMTDTLLAKLIMANAAWHMGGQPLSNAEFRVCSQWGEDGIIQYLLRHVPMKKTSFVEFGVGDYRESNTRFLLMNNNWSGLIIDCNQYQIETLRKSDLYWRHDLTAIHSFITKDNIQELIERAGFGGDIGILSIDVDGNDYWIWDALEASRVIPRIVIVEYNSLFGSKLPVSVPYQPDFERSRAHHSHLYYGASLGAFCWLAERKGYDFVGSNSAGNNAFFVRRDVAEGVRKIETQEGWIESKFRESRDENGAETHATGMSRLHLIKDLPVVNVISGEMKLIGALDLYGVEFATKGRA
jgi:hypothetical protein